jgi:hypothetical protein
MWPFGRRVNAADIAMTLVESRAAPMATAPAAEGDKTQDSWHTADGQRFTVPFL